MMKKRILYFLLAAIAQAAQGQTPTDWYPVRCENRPFVRWWWLGSAVDCEGLTYNLEQFAAKGIGGVEITPIYGVQGNEAHDIDYLSPRWMSMLRHTLDEGHRLGLQIDMNNGTGWPFGGPQITPAYSARKQVVEEWTLRKGEAIGEKIRPRDAKQRHAVLQRIMAVRGECRRDLTARLDADTLLDFRAPSDGWTIYALFAGHTGQQVKRAAPGGVGLVMNHYDAAALSHYLNRFDAAFSAAQCPWPNTVFNDSFEVYGADWDEHLLTEFERMHGYRLETMLPEFLAKDGSDRSTRVVTDYRETLFSLLRDRFTRPWTAWAHARGMRTRNQAHGSPGNIIDLYAEVDIPECESFGQTPFEIPGLHRVGATRASDSDPVVLKFASSAAHLTGKTNTSAESLTWLTQHFCTTLSLAKPEVDQLFAAGVNHLYFHGAPYSPADAGFPGWMFYAAINLSPTNTIWRDAEGLFDYVSRCQSFLTAGTPDNDFLVYLPLYDIWREQQGKQFLIFDIHRMDRTMARFKADAHAVMAAGYDADFVSDRYLQTLRVDADGSLRSEGGTHYRALVLPSCRLLPLATMTHLERLVRDGATVAFIGSVPDDVPGLGDLEKRRRAFGKIRRRMPDLSPTGAVVVTPCGKGRVITGRVHAEVLRATEVLPEPLRLQAGTRIIRRGNEAGGKNYFVAQLGSDAIDGWVTLAAQSAAVEIFDPVGGVCGMAQTRPNGNGTTDVRLQIAAGGSLLLKCFPTEPAAKVAAWRYFAPTAEPQPLDSAWELRICRARSADTLCYKIDSVQPWTNLREVASYCGTARYTCTFTLADPAAADDWLLDLGDVRESAEVYLNGAHVACLWSVPFRTAVGRWLQAGENRLEIDVTNLPVNRIAEMDRKGIEWRIFKDANVADVAGGKRVEFGGWADVPAGLNSTVTLIPMKNN